MSQSKLGRLTGDLITSLVPESSDIRYKRDDILRQLRGDTHGGTRREWEDVQRSLSGLVSSDFPTGEHLISGTVQPSEDGEDQDPR